MTTTPILGLTDLAASQAVPESAVNESLRTVEQGARMFAVEDQDLATPPGSPTDGAAYIVAATATGAWTGWEGRIAYYSTSLGWKSLTPAEGWFAWVKDENALHYYDGAAWSDYGSGVAYTDEQVRDVIGTALTAGTGITITPNDGADTITVAADAAAIKPTESLVIACSDETTALTAGTGKVTFRMPYAFTLTAVRASLTTAQTSGSTFTVDINEAGVSILSTKLTIDNTEKTSTTAATAAVISDTSLADDAEITIDIDTIGDGTAKGLKVYLIGSRT